jgi:Tol biopolymer transport system component
VYQDDEGGVQKVFLVRPDGSGRHALAPTIGNGHQTNPDWSPDGGRLVLAAGTGSTDDLWVANADGTGGEMLLDCTDPCVALDDPAWSPDGNSILYTRLAVDDTGAIGRGSLERLDVATGDVTIVWNATEPQFLAGARFSPDGSNAVLEVVHTDGSGVFEQVTGVELAVVDLTIEPPAPRFITDARLFAATADWSPDGSTIVYSALATADAPAPDLFSIRPDGSGVTRLTTLAESGGSAEHPDFAGSGDTIVFVGSVVGGVGELLALDVATGRIGPAVGTGAFSGLHPRSRPVP